MAEEPNDVSYKNNKHIQRISIKKNFKGCSCMAKWTRFDPRRKGQFTLKCRQPALNVALTNTYH